MSKSMSLERILHSQGFGTRKECRVMVRNEWVTVRGELITDPFVEYELDGFQFEVEDEVWHYRQHAYLMMHKPAHYECSHKPIHHPSSYSLLPEPLLNRGVQCIGRLDEDTTGLLLLSDDGQFIHRMSSPKWKVPKVYLVDCKHPVDSHQIDMLMQGVMLHDEQELLRALACEQISANQIKMSLAQGKYHQVKRMLAAVGNRVEGLQRIQIGPLSLPADLAPSEWRWLSPEQLEMLMQSPKIAS
jgi:16S rRNA pseudouridine516 synthase